MTRVALAQGVVVVTVLLFVAGLAVDLTGPAPDPEEFGLAASAVAYAVVGLVIARKMPRHRVAWVLLTIGFAGTLGGAAEQVSQAVYGDGRSLPGAVWAGWVGDWYWIPWLWGQVVLLPLLFPTGEVPSPRWRIHARVTLALAATTTAGGMFGRSLLLTGHQIGRPEGEVLQLDNPIGFLPLENIETGPYAVWFAALLVLALLALVAVVTRFRRSRGTERAQLKVAVYGLVVTVLGFVLFGGLDAFGVVSAPGETLLLMVIPCSLGVAVLRYRLYDIDRVITRTLAYAVATALLVGVYLGSVVLAQAVLRPVAGRSDLAVAASTLVAAAMFRPVLGQVQTLVDRRFHRRRYDAQQTVAVFGQRLRDEVDLSSLVADLHGTVRDVVAPASVTVWVPGVGSRAPR